MRVVTDASFEDEVLRAEGPVVVDFWAPWCRPCEAATAALAQIALDVVGVDVDANPQTAARYEVLTLPTAILFEGGEPRSTVLGARARSHYERVWASWLGG